VVVLRQCKGLKMGLGLGFSCCTCDVPQLWRVAESVTFEGIGFQIYDEDAVQYSLLSSRSMSFQEVIEGTTLGFTSDQLSVTKDGDNWIIDYGEATKTVTIDFESEDLIGEVIVLDGGTCSLKDVVLSLSWVDESFEIPTDRRTDGFDYHHSDISKTLNAIIYRARDRVTETTSAVEIVREELGVSYQLLNVSGQDVSEWYCTDSAGNEYNAIIEHELTPITTTKITANWLNSKPAYAYRSSYLNNGINPFHASLTVFFDPYNVHRFVEWTLDPVTVYGKSIEASTCTNKWLYYQNSANPGTLFDASGLIADVVAWVNSQPDIPSFTKSQVFNFGQFGVVDFDSNPSNLFEADEIYTVRASVSLKFGNPVDIYQYDVIGTAVVSRSQSDGTFSATFTLTYVGLIGLTLSTRETTIVVNVDGTLTRTGIPEGCG
jgi:hypothetical protein